MSDFELKQCDITQLNIDAIVNAANSGLAGGGGVDGAIHKAAGYRLHDECMAIIKNIGNCKPGNAVITSAGNLKAKFVIHTVGPIWRGGNHNEDKTLYASYFNSLILAESNYIRSIAFPNISTGIYGFPKQQAAEIATEAVRNYFKTYPESIITKLIFVCFDSENFDIYSKLLNRC